MRMCSLFKNINIYRFLRKNPYLLFSFPEIHSSDVLLRKGQIVEVPCGREAVHSFSHRGAITTGRRMTTEASVSSQTARVEEAASS